MAALFEECATEACPFDEEDMVISEEAEEDMIPFEEEEEYITPFEEEASGVFEEEEAMIPFEEETSGVLEEARKLDYPPRGGEDEEAA